ncbi:hypothetical protein [Actinomycetospora aeridis]|uniref:Helix-hairpin-helix protein n=1 Tax=Actinomycetospora aeridis TaxID=3129231 RepID=A0ABU8MYM2_9PSEU
MPIAAAAPPAPSLEVLTQHVVPLHLDPGTEIVGMPHPVHDLGVEELLAGRGLEAAALVGWRHVVRSDRGGHQVVQIGVDSGDGTHRLDLINAGDHVDNLVALHDEGPTPAFEADYRFGLLRVPECYVLAMWFSGVDHDHEFLVPLAPVHSNFAPNQTYEKDEFVRLLEATARQRTGVPVPGDDLALVEGIGPQIADLLGQHGVETFADLAASDPGALREILTRGGPRFNRADPTTWPDQAALAAAQRWEALEELQRRLT